MKRAFFAALAIISTSAVAEQPPTSHLITLEYQRIISGCQMYRLNTPEGAHLLIGHNFNDTGSNAEGGASAGRIGMSAAMYSDPKYRSYLLRGTNELYQPATSDSHTFMTISVEASSSPNNFMLTQVKNIERATPYYGGNTQLSMYFYDEKDYPKYTNPMPKYLSLCGTNVASFEPLTEHRLSIDTKSAIIKVKYALFNQPTQQKATNDLAGEIQLFWNNSDNTGSLTRQHKFTQIARAEKFDKSQDQKFVMLARLGINDDRYIDINSDKNPLIPGKEYVYRIQYCDGYDFCEDGVQAIGKSN